MIMEEMTTQELFRLTQAKYDGLVALMLLSTFILVIMVGLNMVFIVNILIQSAATRREIKAALKDLADATTLVKEHGELTLTQKKDMDKTLRDVKKVSVTQAAHLFHESQQLEVVGKDVKEIKEVVKPSDGSPSGVINLHGPIPKATPADPAPSVES